MKIAVLGMGRMGQALAGRFLDQGHEVVIWNRSPGKAPELVRRGAQEAHTVADAVREAEAVVTSLANDEAVRTVALGDEGVRASMAQGAVYVDTSTVGPSLTGELDGAFPRYVAMPVLGAPAAVSGGQAIYLIGGKDDAVRRTDGWFPGLSDKHFRYQEPARAAAAKLMINTLLLDGIVALSEAVAVGRAGGLSDQQLSQLLEASPMVAPGWRNRLDGVLSGYQDPWWSAVLGAKDARLAVELARAAGTELPETDAARAQYERLCAQDEGADIAGVANLYRR